jgi:hypothetical protein
MIEIFTVFEFPASFLKLFLGGTYSHSFLGMARRTCTRRLANACRAGHNPVALMVCSLAGFHVSTCSLKLTCVVHLLSEGVPSRKDASTSLRHKLKKNSHKMLVR